MPVHAVHEYANYVQLHLLDSLTDQYCRTDSFLQWHVLIPDDAKTLHGCFDGRGSNLSIGQDLLEGEDSAEPIGWIEADQDSSGAMR
jgi:hypothetical protein